MPIELQEVFVEFTWHSRDKFRKRDEDRPNRLCFLSSCFNHLFPPPTCAWINVGNACNFGRMLVNRSIMRKSSLLTLSWTPGLLGSNRDGFEGKEERREQRRPSGLVTDDAKNLSRSGLLPIY